MKILVIDDDKNNREILKRFIELKTSAEVSDASDGTEAWELLQTSKFNIIVSDYLMPNMDGIELLKKIRANKRFDDKIFWLITGMIDESFHREAKELGADAVFTKPAEIDKIIKHINTMLGDG